MGLAQQGMVENEPMASQGAGAGDQAKMMMAVKEVAQMLAQGMSPEELIQKGVPEQLVAAAIQLLQQNQPGQPPAPQTQPGMGGGLAQASGMIGQIVAMTFGDMSENCSQKSTQDGLSNGK